MFNFFTFVTLVLLGDLVCAIELLNVTQHSNLKCTQHICLPSDYNKLVAPFTESGNMEVSINFEIWQILEFDDLRFTVSLFMYIGVSWKEPRLIAPIPDDPNKLMPIDIGFIDHMWQPDIYIYDMKEIKFPKFNIPYAGE